MPTTGRLFGIEAPVPPPCLLGARHEYQMGIILLRRLNDVDRLLVIDRDVKFYRAKIGPADQQIRQRLGVFILLVSERVENSDVVRQLAVASVRAVDEQ
jgi:hypothetical protein